MPNVETEIRKEFQLERIIFFSDAVFAIAVTLLIVDIRIPFQEGITNVQLTQKVVEKIPELFGFLISFFIVAGFWMSHHSLFGHVQHFDRGLMWLNLFFLFFIVLLPFSTDLMGLYGNLIIATSFYTWNVVLAGLMNFFCLHYVASSKRNLSKELQVPQNRRLAYAMALAIPVWVLICWIIGLLIEPTTGDFFLFGLGFVMTLAKKLFKKKD